MQEIVLEIRYFERGLSKSLKKAYFLFFSNRIHINEQDHKTQKGPERWFFFIIIIHKP